VDGAPRLPPEQIDFASARIRQLTARARRAGYRLEHASQAPYDWMLLDAEDGTNVYSAIDLDQIEQWLDE
jgi:hypothetical protein